MAKIHDDVDPIITDASPHGTIETHPSYGVIGASRVSATPGDYLFGSDFRHGHFVMIRIHDATRRRDLSHDWIHSGSHEYIEVALSEAQWAAFVSSLNMGDGVGCSINRVDGKQIPGIKKPVDRRAQIEGEYNADLDRVLRNLDTLSKSIEGLSQAGKRKELQSLVDAIQRDLGSNLGFVRQQFGKFIETTIERAKTEVGAYVQSVLIRTGIKTLQEQNSNEVLLLDIGDQERKGGEQ